MYRGMVIGINLKTATFKLSYVEIMLFVTGLIFCLFSLIIHEVAHGYTAYKLGDLTAKNLGRLSLNPIMHIDVFGTILLPLLCIVTSYGFLGYPVVFGYAKPVPINPYNFKNPRKDMMWVGLSGPAANLAAAVCLSIIIKVLPEPLIIYFTIGALINIVFAVINLIPIPPLDGSRILFRMLPRRLAYEYSKMEPFGFMIIVFLVLLVGRFTILPLIGIIASLLGLPLQ